MYIYIYNISLININIRTAPCTGNKLLKCFEDTLRKGLASIMNLDTSDDQWIQASLHRYQLIVSKNSGIR